MIVRVQSGGQYRLSDEQVARLEDLDVALMTAVSSRHKTTMHALVSQMVTMVRAEGQPVSQQEVLPSDVILPAPDVTVEEIASLLHDDDQPLREL